MLSSSTDPVTSPCIVDNMDNDVSNQHTMMSEINDNDDDNVNHDSDDTCQPVNQFSSFPIDQCASPCSSLRLSEHSVDVRGNQRVVYVAHVKRVTKKSVRVATDSNGFVFKPTTIDYICMRN